MTAFGNTGPDAARAGRGPGGDEHSEERILIKDNRRIDPETGEVRAGGASAQGGSPFPGSAAPGDPAGASQPVSATVTGGSEEVAAARAEAAERTADLQRLTAEYANYRRRVDRDKQIATSVGKASVMGELLAILDDVDRADAHGDLVGGFKTVADKLIETLQRQGLSRYGVEGDEFDPNIHEAVQFATSAEVQHPTVTTVLRPGYLFEERVLRAAVVMVTGPEDGAAASAASPQPAEPADAASADAPDADTPGDSASDSAAANSDTDAPGPDSDA